MIGVRIEVLIALVIANLPIGIIFRIHHDPHEHFLLTPLPILLQLAAPPMLAVSTLGRAALALFLGRRCPSRDSLQVVASRIVCHCGRVALVSD